MNRGLSLFGQRLLIAVSMAVTLLAIPVTASAQSARAAKSVHLRAGPGRDYPVVNVYGPGAPLAVQGCTDGYGWCDVIGPDNGRGWIYAGNISYDYQQALVPLPYYAPTVGIPIITFSLGTYWGSYYRGRPFYGSHRRYEHFRPPPPPVWRPRPGYPPPPSRPPGHYRPGSGGDRPPAPPPRPQQRPQPRPEHQRPPQVSHRPAPPPQTHRPPAQARPAPRPSPQPARPSAGEHRPAPGGGHGAGGPPR